ncbi:MAG: cyclic nucleotide-binding domain-containing protein [Actinobacteria bacterium]|nr:MAG: cyclic nucleotide-binding domain-containing protein [Actinomycetota bacterium]
MTNETDMIEGLARISLFADLARPQLEAILHTYDEELFPEGQRILRQGLSGSGLYIVLDGEAAILINGEERLRHGRGEFFGEVSSLLGEAPTADVVAATPLRCLVVPGPEVRRFLLDNPPVAVRMLEAEARRLATTLQWLE